MAVIGAAVLLAWLLADEPRVHAQQPPATYYGLSASPGDEVAAAIDGVLCEQTTAAADGTWVLRVAEFACGGGAVPDAVVTFSLNGSTANETIAWEPNGVPDDLVNGIDLTLIGTPEQLAAFVGALNLPPAAEHSLRSQARAATRALARGHDAQAARHLDRFVTQAQRLGRGTISEMLSDLLSDTALEVQAAIGAGALSRYA